MCSSTELLVIFFSFQDQCIEPNVSSQRRRVRRPVPIRCYSYSNVPSKKEAEIIVHQVCQPADELPLFYQGKEFVVDPCHDRGFYKERKPDTLRYHHLKETFQIVVELGTKVSFESQFKRIFERKELQRHKIAGNQQREVSVDGLGNLCQCVLANLGRCNDKWREQGIHKGYLKSNKGVLGAAIGAYSLVLLLHPAALESKGAVGFVQKLLQVIHHLFDFGQQYGCPLFFSFRSNLFSTSQSTLIGRVEFFKGLVRVGRSQEIIFNV
mmetsp:Transcript_29164/g.70400  ORF Transcript_29164/g.70400 Transcript_29164/m.70400 type:complete len:267 (+) Transcript_29164:259-1059(+)